MTRCPYCGSCADDPYCCTKGHIDSDQWRREQLAAKDAEIARLKAALEVNQNRATECIKANYEANAGYVHRLELGIEELAGRAERSETQCDNLHTALRETREALVGLEWVEYNDSDHGVMVFCPVCRRTKGYPHYECELKAVLARHADLAGEADHG